LRTDQSNNQIASFYTGAMADAGQLSFRGIDDCGLTILSPTIPEPWSSTPTNAARWEIPYIFDPGQQCARMSGDELKEGVVGATVVICNDYEFELLNQKTACPRVGSSITPRRSSSLGGENGSSVITRDRRFDIPAVTPRRNCRSHGSGDAFRGGS